MSWYDLIEEYYEKTFLSKYCEQRLQDPAFPSLYVFIIKKRDIYFKSN